MTAHRVPLKSLRPIGLLLGATLSLTACNTSPATYTIGGTVVNLVATGGGLMLQNNSQNNLSVNTNGSFTFSTSVPSGSSYSVTISSQPSNPTQLCGVVNGSGTATANVTSIQINCGHNEWAWQSGANTVSGATGVYGTMGVASMSNAPGPRQQPLTWTDASGNFWLFGGQVWISTSVGYARMNDLWKYSSGQWTWVAGSNVPVQSGTYGTLGVAAPANSPGPRFQAVGWTDASGNLWFFGGEGYDSAGNEGTLNDLWKFSAGEWTWMGGSDLINQPGTYGTEGVASASNIPSTRQGAVSWTDSSGDFWLFGGLHSTGTVNSWLNDLWKYSSGEWTWESGSQSSNANGVYGTQGTPASGNFPGARQWSIGWIDSSGSLWLFGGDGYPATGSDALLNDLWKYSNGEWTWESGTQSPNANGAYGTQGVSAANNSPGSRQMALSWIDSEGNFWLFGGNAFDSVGGEGLLNDLWKYSNGQWTWVSGSKIINQYGVYGTQTMLSPGNIPGARASQCGWIDINGNLWVFGGFGEPASGTEGNLNDLWMYMP